MIPYVGIVAGVVDAVLYFQEGNYMEGLLCIAGACIGAGGAMAAVGAAKGVCAVTTAGMALKTAGTAFTATVMMQYTIEGAEKTLDIMAANGGKMNREAWMSAAQTAMCGMGAVAGFMAVGSCIDEMASLSARGLACFVAGTKVLTDEGLKNIEDIQAGDYVYSTDEETGESGYKEVVNTFAKDTEVLTHVAYELEDESYSYSQSEHKESYIDKENIHCNDRGEDGYNNRGNSEQQESTTKYSSEIITTMNHRFWCEGEWKSAGTLEEGDILTLADGSEAIVTEVTFEETHTTVYNMEVADYHTYYVGEDSVLVHNNVSCKTPTGVVIEDGALSGSEIVGEGGSNQLLLEKTPTRRELAEQKLAEAASGINNKTIDSRTNMEIGRFIGDDRGNVFIEPVGGTTVPAGRNGVDTHTLYPNGSNYNRYNPVGHGNNTTPHGHGHIMGTGPGRRGQGPSIDVLGNVVPFNSPDAHWTIH